MHAKLIHQDLWLPPHTRACALDGQVILLDLRRNRYMAVPESPALSLGIGGWPPCLSPTSTRVIDSWSIARRLQSRGLLVDHPVPLRPPTDLPEPGRCIDFHSRAGQGRTALTNVIRIVSSTMTAAWWLRHRSLATIVNGIESSRRGHVGQDSATELDRLSAAYARLKPLVLTSRDQCLLDSLALLRFLSHWQLAATWVIGVKTRPFAAHSWLQCGSSVLNDHHERVRQYRPILIV